jgi:hypothetical protein
LSREIATAVRFGTEDAVEADFRAVSTARAAWPCGRERGDSEGVAIRDDHRAALEHAAQALDVGGGPIG